MVYHVSPSLPSRDIQQLLSVSFTHSESTLDLKDSYLLLVATEIGEGEDVWTGKTVEMKTSAETTISISEIQVRLYSTWSPGFHTGFWGGGGRRRSIYSTPTGPVLGAGFPSTPANPGCWVPSVYVLWLLGALVAR